MKKLFLLFVIPFLTLSLASCNDSTNDSGSSLSSNISDSPTEFVIRWVNYNQTVLDTETYKAGEIPSYKKDLPIKPSDNQFSYTFSGWSPEISKVTKDQTYVAQFGENTRSYKITWVNYDSTVLEVDSNVPYGTTPTYNGATPRRPKTAMYTYSFSGWLPTVTPAEGDKTYTACYSQTTNTYDIIWKNYNGDTLYTETYECGQTPSYKGETPTRASTNQLTYSFSGWSPAITAVQKNQTYTAQFTESQRMYSITWKNYNEQVLRVDSYGYGQTPSYNSATPKKPKDAQYTYSFTGWSPAITPVYTDKTYTAQFSNSINSYTVTWKNYDGTILDVESYKYGVKPSYKGETPTREGDSSLLYLFKSWDQSILPVTGDITYTAIYDNAYEILWANEDGTILARDVVKEGVKPSYSGATPYKYCADAENYYSFAGWDEEIVPATSKKTYTATFELAYGYEMVIYNNIGYKITKCYLNEREGIIIPSTYKSGLPVVAIDTYAFQNFKTVKNIYIPDSVTSIERKAFTGCSSLEELTIPSSVTYIGDCAFENCNSLTSLVVPKIREKIGQYFGYSNTTIPECLTNVVIGNGSDSIPSNAFSDCSHIESVSIAEGVKTIENKAFNNCSSLKIVDLPDSLESIGGFMNCTSLASIDLPSNITSIIGSCFSGCTALESIELSNNIERIGAYAFENCTSLTSFVVPDSVTSLGKAIFANCSSLQTLTLPYIGTSTTNSTYIGYFFSTSSYTPSESDIPHYNGSSLPQSLTKLIISDACESFSNTALVGCRYITSLTLPFVGLTPTTKTQLSYLYGAKSWDASVDYYNLREVIIGDACTSIKAYAFYKCYYLTSIIIGNNVQSIGENAFKDCRSLTSITIPDDASSIGSNAFDGCTNLTEIVIREQNESYASQDGALYNKDKSTLIRLYNKSTTTFVVPSTVTTIGSEAFSDCKHLTSVTIPSSVTSIEDSAFKNCTALKTIVIPDNVTSIGSTIFAGCTAMKNLTLPYIGSSVSSKSNLYQFFGTSTSNLPTTLTTITISDKCTSLNSGALNGCTKVESLTIPFVGGSVTSNTFLGYIFGASSYTNNASKVPTSLTSLTLGKKCTTLGEYALYGCSNIKTLTFLGNAGDFEGYLTFDSCGFKDVYFVISSIKEYLSNSKYGVQGRANNVHLVNRNMEEIVHVEIPSDTTEIRYNAFYNCNFIESVSIPNGVTTISRDSFHACKSLKSVTIPNSVTNIYDCAFILCSALEEVTLSSQLTTINRATFEQCTSLKSIIIPNGVTCIGASAFFGCVNLESVSIPNSVTTIDTSAFYGCKKLKEIDLTHVTDIQVSSFYECSSLKTITIPYGVTSIPENAFYGCSSLESVSIPETVTIIGSRAFSGCSSLKNINLPNSLLSIHDNAFSYCSGLESMHLGNSIEHINWQAFYNCTSLKSIEIPDSVTSIGYSAFYGCTSLETISLPKNITVINSGLFYGCSSLEAITIPNGVTTIESKAFYNCTSLISIDIPDSVTSLGNYAFCCCENLESIRLSNNITSIPNYAFRECESLQSIEIPDSVTTIGYYAFYYCRSLRTIIISTNVTSIDAGAFISCGFETVFYEGTAQQYVDLNYSGFDLNKVYFYSESAPLSEGNYWHYVSGVPTIWE